MSDACPFCGSKETGFNQAVNDTFCNSCGNWFGDFKEGYKFHVDDLRVLTIPSEEGYDINEQSTIDEVLASPGLTSWRLGEYFSANNGERLDLLHWSFLINIKTKENLTGLEIIDRRKLHGKR